MVAQGIPETLPESYLLTLLSDRGVGYKDCISPVVLDSFFQCSVKSHLALLALTIILAISQAVRGIVATCVVSAKVN